MPIIDVLHLEDYEDRCVKYVSKKRKALVVDHSGGGMGKTCERDDMLFESCDQQHGGG